MIVQFVISEFKSDEFETVTLFKFVSSSEVLVIEESFTFQNVENVEFVIVVVPVVVAIGAITVSARVGL